MLQVFPNANKKKTDDSGLGDLDAETARKIRDIKLTRSEFAESMGLQPSSMFVRNMFLLVDRTKDGFVSFDEFMNMFLTMANGEITIVYIIFTYLLVLAKHIGSDLYDFTVIDQICLFFQTGNSKEKAKMLFDMYDLKRRGQLSRDDFSKMIR